MIALAATLVLAAGQSPAAPPREASPLLERIVVLGASVSDGYGLHPEVGARTGFADLVDATILAPHGVRPATSLFFFTSPDSIAERLVAQARAADPTLVVAIDYLFWFGYGIQESDEARRAHLEKGLASLEAFACPLLLGDLPDMRSASEPAPPGGFPPLLVPEQVPSKELLASLNARIRGWAADRRGVVVVPVAELIARLHAGLATEIRGNRWADGARAKLIGPDRLHPTLAGAIALWIASLDRLVAAREDLDAASFEWDAEAIARRVVESKAKAKPKAGAR